MRGTSNESEGAALQAMTRSTKSRYVRHGMHDRSPRADKCAVYVWTAMKAGGNRLLSRLGSTGDFME